MTRRFSIRIDPLGGFAIRDRQHTGWIGRAATLERAFVRITTKLRRGW